MKAYSLYSGLGVIPAKVRKRKNHRKMEEEILELFPSIRRQTIHGFGGALTHASGHVFNKMKKGLAEEVLRQYYSKEEIGYRYVRIPLDSCDFSPSTFNAALSFEDIALDKFDFSKDEEYIFPWLEKICEIAEENIPIMLSPWSPPAYMKDNNSRLRGGKLLEEMRQPWAKYMARYALEYRKRGFNVWALTIQNEPNAIQTWDSCLYTAEEERIFLLDYLRPELDSVGLKDVEVFFWDHNKERLIPRSEQFFKQGVENIVPGIAFHGYCGDHFRSLELYRDKFPKHRMILTEFCMAHKDRFDFNKQLDVYGHEFIGDIAAGADTLIDWNLILDHKGGPNHVGNYCMAPVMTDAEYRPHYNMAFKVISTLSSCIRPGDVVIEHSKYKNDIDVVAVISPNDGIRVIIGAIKSPQSINVRIREQVFSFTVPAGTLTVLELEGKDYEQN